MKQAAVHIATTEGPSAIQRITAEDPDVRSVVCLAGRAIALPISGDYDAFVRRPTGVVEACFGHGAYRVDISEPIAGGLSWQLGIFVAHALADRGCLAGPAALVGRIVWATGEVTRDLAVAPVEEVALKIRRSDALFRAALARAAEIVVLVPAANLDEATVALAALLGEDASGITVVPIETATGALSAIGLRGRRSRRWLPRNPGERPSRKALSRTALYAAYAALSVAAIVTGWSRFATEPWPSIAMTDPVRPRLVSLPLPAKDRLTVAALEMRPPAGSNCAEVLFDVVAPRLVQKDPDGLPVATAGLCDFRYSVTNATGRALSLHVLTTRDGGQKQGFRVRLSRSARLLSPGISIELDARPPRRMNRMLVQSVLLFASTPDAEASLSGILARAGGARSSAEVTALVVEARGLGAVVRVVSQKFTPQTFAREAKAPLARP
jgi:hypothetical protein